MATRSIRPKRDESPLKDWQPAPERAPSVIRSDRPLAVRIIAFVSLMMLAVGGLAMVLAAYGRPYLIGPEWGFFWFSLGLAGLMFHAFSDRDLNYRRTYAVLGVLLVLVGAILHIWHMGAYFLPYGTPCLTVAMLFLFAVARHEDDPFWKVFIKRLFGIVGGVMVVAAFFFSLVNVQFWFISSTTQNFLPGEGVLLGLLGLFYLAGFIGMQEPGGHTSFRTGLGIGALGAVVFVVALLRSIFGGAPNQSYLVPDGLLLMGLALVYIGFALGVCSDNVVVVLTRRELMSFFYSPIAYLVILGMSLVGFSMFWLFVGQLQRGPLREPVVIYYIISFVPVVCLIFVVPVITMRLLSEEKRSGTLEVLLTAPVGEAAVVVSKFLASLIFFILACSPWALYLVALRVVGKEEFDYRPMLAFFIALVVSGSGFLAIGLFFSSVTRNQIIAAVLTFAVMMGLSVVYFLTRSTFGADSPVLTYISFLDLWIDSLEGKFAPRYLLFHASVAVFFLYLTVKVLDARKWA